MPVYLLHFDTPLGSDNPRGKARHYLGQTPGPLDNRLEVHRKASRQTYSRGRDAKIMCAANDQGITWKLVRTWPGDYVKEKELKRQKNSPRLCPICNKGGE